MEPHSSNENRHTYNMEGRLRILMVSDFFYPNTGGVESHIYQLAQCMIARGHCVCVFTHAYGNVYGVKHLTNGLRVYYVPRLAIYEEATLPTIFGSFNTLREIVVMERIELVHCHQAFSPLANEAALHARTMGMPVVFTDHSLFGFADTSSILLNKALKFSMADVHAVICVSHVSRANTILRACVPPQRVCVVPNAVDASRFPPRLLACTTTNGNRYSRTLFNEGNNVVVVVMSRLVYRKGIDLLAAVIPELCNRHPCLKFIIGGDGPKRQLLSQTVCSHGLDDKVKLIGAVPPDEVRDILIQGDIFLNCSLTEAFCIALVEAASAGLLAVSTRVGGVPEVLPPDMLLLADPSPEGILRAMDEAIVRVKGRSIRDENELCIQHSKVKNMYSWHIVAKRTEQIYLDAIGTTRDDSMTARLRRYSRCGKWFGKICCCLAVVDWMYLKWLQWRWPDNAIEKAIDFPKIHQNCNAAQ